MIQDNLKHIHDSIAEAVDRAGRAYEEVRLMVVSKTQPVERIAEVYECGERLFGENRVLEAAEKFGERFPEAELHLIGHIQRNKARSAAEIAACVQSIDSERTVAALEKHLAALGGELTALLEFNAAGEESKQGIRSEDDLYRLAERLLESPTIRPAGLMTMAPFTDDEKPIRAAFRRLYNLREECARRFGEEHFPVLSMGMSNDYRIAIEEGSTLVRIGTAVFGARG